MKNLTLIGLLFIAQPLFAEPLTAQQGLTKINTNLENALANKNEYSKNLEIVSKNKEEVSKAKTQVIKQKELISSEIIKNNDSVKKILLQEKDLNKLIEAEKEKLAQEAKQLEQVEKLAAQIKQNQLQREQIIADYQAQLTNAGLEKKTWKDREAELRTEEGKAIQSVRKLASDEVAWTNKKRGYEGELKRWAVESEKQQKINSTYQGLTKDSQ